MDKIWLFESWIFYDEHQENVVCGLNFKELAERFFTTILLFLADLRSWIWLDTQSCPETSFPPLLEFLILSTVCPLAERSIEHSFFIFLRSDSGLLNLSQSLGLVVRTSGCHCCVWVIFGSDHLRAIHRTYWKHTKPNTRTHIISLYLVSW